MAANEEEKTEKAEMAKIFGQAVRRLRTKQDVSQENFALTNNIDRSYMTSVECGRRNVTIYSAVKIADGLHISLSELFAEVDRIRAEQAKTAEEAARED